MHAGKNARSLSRLRSAERCRRAGGRPADRTQSEIRESSLRDSVRRNTDSVMRSSSAAYGVRVHLRPEICFNGADPEIHHRCDRSTASSPDRHPD